MKDNNTDMERHLDIANLVAVVGMAGRFPEADDVDQFWQNLRDQKQSIRKLKEAHKARSGIDPCAFERPNYVDAFGWLDNVDMFDPDFFAMSKGEAQLRDPQHRLLLEVCYHALENAGYAARATTGDIALFAGTGSSGYFYKNLLPNQDLVESWGLHALSLFNEKDFAATFVSYKLSLTGASINVNTGCSSSLVAIHLAAKHLLNNEAKMVLAGASSINSDQEIGYFYEEGGIHPPDGRVRPFDEDAHGTIGGSGAGIVVLKRLQDAIDDGDHIHGILVGSAVNNDGDNKIGYTAPSIDAQSNVIKQALAFNNVNPESISFVEAHGTGTILGDPIEIQALSEAYGGNTAKKQFCKVGAVKSNIGHLGAASGVVGLIKVLKSLEHKKIPATLNYRKPNSEIDFANSPFSVNNTLIDWQGPTPLRAGVSSFGIGGTNAHVIVQQWQTCESSKSHLPQVLPVSGKTQAAVLANSRKLLIFLADNQAFSLSDIAYTLQNGRYHHAYRSAIAVAQDERGSVSFSTVRQANKGDKQDTVLMFPGQGSQSAAMAQDLYSCAPVFKAAVDRCCQLSETFGFNLQSFFVGSEENKALASRTDYTQPLLFICEYAYAKLLEHYGVKGDAYVGHSVGEYLAAHLAGVFSLEDALRVVCVRGKIMAKADAGSMLSVSCYWQELTSLVEQYHVEFAAINSPVQTVISGDAQSINALESALKEKGIDSCKLQVSHGFHSRLMDPVLEEFLRIFDGVTLSPAQKPFLSNVSGEWINPGEILGGDYWVSHLRGCVRFSDCVAQLIEKNFQYFVECGPADVLSGLVRAQSNKATNDIFVIPLSGPRYKQIAESVQFFNGIANLWALGFDVDFDKMHEGKRFRVPLPTYTFDKISCWVSPPNALSVGRTPENQPAKLGAARAKNLIATPQVRVLDIWKQCFANDDILPQDDFYELGGDSLLASKIISRVKKEFDCELSLIDFMGNATVEGLASIVEKAKAKALPERVLGEI